VFDNLFYLAVMAFAFGLSLSTYRLFAIRNSWPMGAFHADLPAVPIMIGLVSVTVAILFAAARAETGGWIMVGVGLVVGLLWTGLLRVGSQLSLFLAPLATGLLLLGWLGSMFGYDRAASIVENPKELFNKPRIEGRP
jgi:ribose/xylose/arabinose/galactoside ABC-type transport system permease subunit